MSIKKMMKKLAKHIIPDPVLFSLSQRVLRRYSQFITWATYGRKYTAPINPLQLYYINPLKVNYKIVSIGKRNFELPNVASEIIDGEWSENKVYLDTSDQYRSFYDHFANQIPWEETEFYISETNYINSNGSKFGCKNVEEFHDRLEELDKLYKNISNQGYKKQSELMKYGDVPAHRRIHKYWPPELNEVQLVIDEKGEYMLYDGRHRFQIARILEINSIPVRIRGRHKKWQEIRDEYATSGDLPNDNLENHPDLKNI